MTVRKFTILVVALLLLALLYCGVSLFLLGPGVDWKGLAGTGAPEPEAPVEAAPSLPASAPPEASPGTGDESAEDTPPPGGITGGEIGEGSETEPSSQVADIPEVPPALKPNPRAPPPPRPGRRPLGGGSRPPVGPTGLWERFPPLPPSGRAAIRATVLDRDGKPVAGADVYLGPPGALGSSAVSFGDLRKIGRTDATGTVLGEKLPEGAAALAANLGNLLNGRRGLDARTSVRVVLEAGKTVEGTVTLPFSQSEFGAVAGRVIGPDERPIRGAQVYVGYARAMTAADGTFRIENVRAGERSVTASRSGYRRAASTIVVKAGGATEAEIALGYREAGTLDLTGTVTGPDGEPVADANVYLIVDTGAGRGTIRSERADAQGRFSMPSLPERLAEADVRIQANRTGYRPGNLRLPEGLKTTEVDVRLPLRLVKLTLVVRDAATGEPQTRCRFGAAKEGRDRPVAAFASRNAEGRYETWVEAGVHTFTIEAPDHDTLVSEVDVGAAGGEYEYVASLVRTAEEAVEVVLTVVLVADAGGEAVERARVEVSDFRSGEALARLEGERPGGRFVLPVPSGKRRIRVTASGFEPIEAEADLRPETPEVELELRLRSR